MDNCPSEFYNNCKNSMKHCFKCNAMSGTNRGKLLYEPRVDIGDHPHKNYKPTPRPIDTKKSKLVKKALKSESAQIKKVNKAVDKITKVAKGTIGSGRVHGDGDALHLEHRVERKYRSTAKSLTVSSVELAKGKAQKIDVFEIFLAEPKETYYVLNEQTYIDMLAKASLFK